MIDEHPVEGGDFQEEVVDDRTSDGSDEEGVILFGLGEVDVQVAEMKVPHRGYFETYVDCRMLLMLWHPVQVRVAEDQRVIDVALWQIVVEMKFVEETSDDVLVVHGEESFEAWEIDGGLKMRGWWKKEVMVRREGRRGMTWARVDAMISF